MPPTWGGAHHSRGASAPHSGGSLEAMGAGCEGSGKWLVEGVGVGESGKWRK